MKTVRIGMAKFRQEATTEPGPVCYPTPQLPRVGRTGMIGMTMTMHVTETELARDLHAVLEKVRQGFEVAEDFARDVEEGIQEHREPWNPPSLE